MIRYLKPRAPSLTQQELFDLLAAGDQQGFNHVYSQYRPMVCKILQSKGCPQATAEDLFQEGVFALWQNIKDGKYTLQSSTKISSYLVQICHNRWIDTTRRVAYRNTSYAEDVPETNSETANSADYLEREARHELLDAAFEQLGERCQDMLKRFYVDRYSMGQLAESRGITTATAKNEKYRCVQRLKKLTQKSA